jgi:hypothetical protein
MHGAHEHTVLDLGKAQIQGREQEGVSTVDGHGDPFCMAKAVRRRLTDFVSLNGILVRSGLITVATGMAYN